MKRLGLYFLAFTMMAGTTGCASISTAVMSGGKVVDSAYVPEKILATYKVSAEGLRYDGPGEAGKKIPSGLHNNTIYQLVGTPEGYSIFEKEPNSMASLCSTHWDDSENDIYECYMWGKHAFQYIVPKDRTKDVKRYHYGQGEKRGLGNMDCWFSTNPVNGKKRIVPNSKAGFSVVILTPVTTP